MSLLEQKDGDNTGINKTEMNGDYNNIGAQVVCFPYMDYTNLPFGLCAITAIGDFNYQNGIIGLNLLVTNNIIFLVYPKLEKWLI
jgi:hypothetical protein